MFLTFAARGITGLLVGCFLMSCGGGGRSSSPPPPPPPAAPSGLTYATPQTYTVNVAIAALTPAVTGVASTFTVSPALPAGLELNPTTGTISGTPSSVTARTDYVVTAANSGGSTTASVSIAVNDVPPAITYSPGAFTFTTGVPVTGITPVVSGGAVVSFAINPALPAGLTFDASSGVISGTPAVPIASTEYIVTAQNSGGGDDFSLTIAVRSGVLLDLGHAGQIGAVIYKGNRILTSGTGGLALWDAQTGAIIRRMTSACTNTCGDLAQLAGDTVAARQETGFHLYSATDGEPLAQIFSPSANTRWTLASDGSYVVSQGFQRLQAWNRSGTLLLTVDGNFYDAGVFAAPGEIRVANGPGGPQRVQVIIVPGGTSSVGPLFTGIFNSWFDDGERFITQTGTTLRIYARDGTELDVANHAAVPMELSGSGDWYRGEFGNTVHVWAVGSAGVAAASYPLATLDRVQGMGRVFAILRYGIPSLSVVDLDGPSPSKSDYVSPVGSLGFFAGESAGDWVFTAARGAMFGELGAGVPQRYSFGAVLGIAGGESRVVVATTSGHILHFDAATQALEGEMALSVDEIALSADGSVLAASADSSLSQYVTDRTLRVFALPSHELLTERPYTFGIEPHPLDFTLSASGQVLAQTLDDSESGWIRQAERLDGTLLLQERVASFQSLLYESTIMLSESGTRVAFAETSVGDGNATGIYVDGARTGAAVGWPSGWLDEARLLVNRYRGVYDEFAFVGSDIVNIEGQVTAQPPLPDIRRFQRVSPNVIYSPEFNVIVDVATGETIWSSAAPIAAQRGQTHGAVAGNFVYFRSENTVRVEPR